MTNPKETKNPKAAETSEVNGLWIPNIKFQLRFGQYIVWKQN